MKRETESPASPGFCYVAITVTLGTMCVLDTMSRRAKRQIDRLRTLARQMMMQLELRKMPRVGEQTSDYARVCCWPARRVICASRCSWRHCRCEAGSCAASAQTPHAGEGGL